MFGVVLKKKVDSDLQMAQVVPANYLDECPRVSRVSAASPELARKPGEWQSFDITLVGRWITVVQNGQTIIAITRKSRASRAVPWTATRNCLVPSISKGVKRARGLSQYCYHTSEVVKPISTRR
jgi:hypothetical protein